jgi:hypothetical protein
MHHLSLLLGDMMSHWWAKGLMVEVQRIVQWSRQSVHGAAVLKQHGCGRLCSANATRFTSAYAMAC